MPDNKTTKFEFDLVEDNDSIKDAIKTKYNANLEKIDAVIPLEISSDEIEEMTEDSLKTRVYYHCDDENYEFQVIKSEDLAIGELLTPPTPHTLTNHEFICWNDRADSSGNSYTSESTCPITDGELHLYSIYQANDEVPKRLVEFYSTVDECTIDTDESLGLKIHDYTGGRYTNGAYKATAGVVYKEYFQDVDRLYDFGHDLNLIYSGKLLSGWAATDAWNADIITIEDTVASLSANLETSETPLRLYAKWESAPVKIQYYINADYSFYRPEDSPLAENLCVSDGATYDYQDGSYLYKLQATPVIDTVWSSYPSRWLSARRSGYGFGGWYTSLSGGGAYLNNSLEDSLYHNYYGYGDLVKLYAHWTAKHLSIYLYRNYDGLGSDDNPVSGDTFSTNSLVSSYTLNQVSTRTGYTFDGLYLSPTPEDGDTNFAEDLTKTSFNYGLQDTSPINLYCKWTAKLYTIRYNTQIDGLTVSNRQFMYEEPGVGAVQPDRFGYKVNYWSWDANPAWNAQEITAEDTPKSIGLSSNSSGCELFAQWVGIRYKIYLYSSLDSESPTSYIRRTTGSSVKPQFDYSSISRDGYYISNFVDINNNALPEFYPNEYDMCYEFTLDWSQIDHSIIYQQETDTSGIYEDCFNVYAMWSESFEYTIIYHKNDGTDEIATQTSYYGQETELADENLFTIENDANAAWGLTASPDIDNIEWGIDYYDFNDPIYLPTLNNNQELHLYAIWESTI